MSARSTSKTTSLKPSWKHFFFRYLFSILTIPIFGIGLIAFYLVRKKHTSISFTFSDEQISSHGSKYQRNIDLVNIQQVTIHKTRMDERLGIGTLIISTSASDMKLVGMEDPEELKEILEIAIQAQKQAADQQQQNKPAKPKYHPGSMAKMDYLTGLWQQGLISDEDFEKERKHFE